MMKCDPKFLIEHLRLANKQAKVALYVDETMLAYNAFAAVGSNAGAAFLHSITSLQDDGIVSTFFTGLRSGPFLKACSESGRQLIALLLLPIAADRYAEFFPPDKLHHLIPASVLAESNGDIGRVCEALSRYLFSLTAGYPRLVQILQTQSFVSEEELTLSRVLSKAVAATRMRYSNDVSRSAVALGALNVRVPRGLFVRVDPPSSDPIAREECRTLLKTNYSLEDSVPPGYRALDEMVSRGTIFITTPDQRLTSVFPYVPPMLLLAHFADQVFAADIREVQRLISKLRDDNNKLDELVVCANGLAAQRRLELWPDIRGKKKTVVAFYKLESDTAGFWGLAGPLISIVQNFTASDAKDRLSLLREKLHSDKINTFCSKNLLNKSRVSWLDDICTLASDARGLVGDASLLAILGGKNRTTEALESAIHNVNSETMERWHARYECMMRCLYADADQYLPDVDNILPNYKCRPLSMHYNAGAVTLNSSDPSFDWTQPMEMVLGVKALPNGSDPDSINKAKGKMLVMKETFAGFDSAWVAHRLDGEGAGRPMLFLEQVKLQRSMSSGPSNLIEMLNNLRNALKKAKEANWDPSDVVFVYKSTRPMEEVDTDILEEVIDSEMPRILSRKFKKSPVSDDVKAQFAADYKAERIHAWKSTNVVLLCGKDGLGEYLGPMLWGALTAGDALGPAVSSQDGDAAGHEEEGGQK
jgi:hypothetical protein